ncbi:MAG: FAD-dependent oxidoreductase [Kiritimatiellae bacterium]|nr:FAD-dependent oxidoreductase [Kiritimatiellia bacterium]
MEKKDVIIIGGGPAGRSVVHMLHKAGFPGSVTLIKNEEINVNRCAIPYGISHEKPTTAFQIPNALISDFGAELLIDEVSILDTTARRVKTAAGLEMRYQHLVLATGAQPLIPKIPGGEAGNVVPVRALADLERLRDLTPCSKKAVIVGGGYIGVEAAVGLRRAGLEVALVEMQPHILMATAEPEFIAPLENALKEQGVKLLTGRRVESFELTEGCASAVRLDDGQALKANFVVMAAGVLPDTRLAEASGIRCSRYGIVTDDYLRTSAGNIYTAGDCAEKKSFITGNPAPGEFGTNAVFMGKVVARNILEKPTRFPGIINSNVSTVFDWAIGSAGLTEAAASAQGIKAVSGIGETLDRYPMMAGASPVRVKLVFNRETRKIIGGSVLRRDRCAAANVDFISLAIQKGATMEDISQYQYSTHPELAAKPSDNFFVFASLDAEKKDPL